jgi:chromosome segregation ATPase
MDINTALAAIEQKITLLTQRYNNSQALNKELKEEVRLLNTQLNEYTELMGDLEMELVTLKKEIEKKKK